MRIQDPYSCCVCTPKRADVINPVTEPTLGTAAVALLEVTATIYTLVTIAWVLLR